MSKTINAELTVHSTKEVKLHTDKNRGPFHYYNDCKDEAKEFGARVLDIWTKDELLEDDRFIIFNDGFHIIDGIASLQTFLANSADHAFECILGDKPQKIRFDFDGDLSMYTEAWLSQFFDHLVLQIQATFQSMYGVAISVGTDLIITDSSLAGSKFSKHIIINNFCVNSAADCGSFYNEVMKQLKVKNRKYDAPTIVDSTIYKSFQRFRMLGSCKKGTTRIKTASTLINVQGKSYDQPRIRLADTLLTFTSNCKALANTNNTSTSTSTTNTRSVKKLVPPTVPLVVEPFQLKELNRVTQTLQLLLQIIDKRKRMVTRADWINVGLIIYNEIGSIDFQKGLGVYTSFCEPRYTSECADVFKSFKVSADKKIQIGTLVHWAKEDCPQLFQHPFKHYIFEEPDTFTLQELLNAAACGELGVYPLILAQRMKKGNQLEIYDPNHPQYYNKILQYTGQHLSTGSIARIKQYLCQTMAVIESGGLRMVKCKVRNDSGEMDYTETTFQNWKNNHSFNVTIDVETKRGTTPKSVPFYKVVEPMLISLQFECSSFIPYANAADRAKIPPYVFNTFTGFKAQHTIVTPMYSPQRRQQLIQPMLDHLKLLCGSEADIAYDYLVCWLAYKLQFPRVKIGVALVMRSLQGAGKNIPFDFFSKYVIGDQYYRYINKIEQITGDFNGLMDRNLLTFLDEIQNYGGAFKSNDLLKSILTQVQQNINKKNVEAFESNDYSHYVFATNNKWPVKVTRDDRRHFCITPSNEKIGNKDYFDRLVQHSFTDECGKAFYDYLMEQDLSKWDKTKIPKTKFRMELIHFSQSKVVDFLSDFVHELSALEVKVSLAKLYTLYNSWFSANGIDHRQHLDKNQVSEELAQFAQDHQPKINFKKYNWIDKASGKRSSVLTFWCSTSDLKAALGPVEPVDCGIEFEYTKDSDIIKYKCNDVL